MACTISCGRAFQFGVTLSRRGAITTTTTTTRNHGSPKNLKKSFPFGKFFAQLNYYSAETGHAKQLLIDISLLALQIRSTIVHEFEALFGKNSHHHEVYPTFSLLVIDVSMAQAEKHKLIQNIFAKLLEQLEEIGDKLRHSFSKQPFEFLSKMKSDFMPAKLFLFLGTFQEFFSTFSFPLPLF